jgi:hypothetical protein
MTTQKTLTPLERMQKAGLTIEQLREVVGGLSGTQAHVRRDDFIARVREAGLTMEQVKKLIDKGSDDNSGEGPGTVSDRVL